MTQALGWKSDEGAVEIASLDAQVNKLNQALTKSNDNLSSSQHNLIAELAKHDESNQQLASVSAELKAY